MIAVIEMSASSWLVGATVPGIARSPIKKLAPDEASLLELLERWRGEGAAGGAKITRIAVAYEAGRDGFWLARWLRARGMDIHVIHPTSVAVSRTHRRAKTDRLDVAMLKRAFLGWLRGEPDHCTMAPIPTLAEEDARRPNRERKTLVGEKTRLVNRMKATLARHGIRGFNPALKKAPLRLAELTTPEGVALAPNTLDELRRDMARLRLVREQIAEIEAARRDRLETVADEGPDTWVRLLGGIHGLGLDTADLLVHEVLARNPPNRRALARYGSLTGAPDESGRRRREKGLARAGNARVRNAMIQFAWRFLRFQKDCVLAKWFHERTRNAGAKRKDLRKTFIVALARKLLVALWRLVTTGEVPQGLVMRPVA